MPWSSRREIRQHRVPHQRPQFVRVHGKAPGTAARRPSRAFTESGGSGGRAHLNGEPGESESLDGPRILFAAVPFPVARRPARGHLLKMQLNDLLVARENTGVLRRRPRPPASSLMQTDTVNDIELTSAVTAFNATLRRPLAPRRNCTPEDHRDARATWPA